MTFLCAMYLNCEQVVCMRQPQVSAAVLFLYCGDDGGVAASESDDNDLYEELHRVLELGDGRRLMRRLFRARLV